MTYKTSSRAATPFGFRFDGKDSKICLQSSPNGGGGVNKPGLSISYIDLKLINKYYFLIFKE